MNTKVVFKLENGGDVLAVMPYEPGGNNPRTCTVYAHIGQHSAAAWGYVAGLKNATPEQYAPVLAELRSIGYDPAVLKRLPGDGVAFNKRAERLIPM